VAISNNNQTANFTIQAPSATLSGRVTDNLGNPVTNMNIFAFPNLGGFSPNATTDGGRQLSHGHFRRQLFVALNTDPNTGAASRGLVSPSLPVNVTDGVNITGFQPESPQRVYGHDYRLDHQSQQSTQASPE